MKIIEKNSLVSSLVSKTKETVEHFKSGKIEEAKVSLGELSDIAQVWECAKDAEIESIPVFPGMGSLLKEDSQIGQVISKLKSVLGEENPNDMMFRGGIAQLTEIFEAEKSDEQDQGTEKEEVQTQESQPENNSESETEKENQEEVNSEKEDEAQQIESEKSSDQGEASRPWGFDMAADRQREKREQTEKEKAQERKDKLEKAASQPGCKMTDWNALKNGKPSA